MEIGALPVSGPTGPGKSAQAVGQVAKAAVAEARAAGVELPKNAQGMAASAIAKGAEPASVFAAIAVPVSDDPAPVADDPTVPEGETPTPIMDGEVPVAPSEGEDTDTTDDAAAIAAAQQGYTEASSVLGAEALTAAQTSLALLEAAA